MQITIHRGTQEIGGSCVQVTSGDYSILLDAGSPLGNSNSQVDLSKLKFTDVFISHPHQDHWGMITGLDESKTIYIGKLAKELICLPSLFLREKPLTNSFKTITNREPVDVGPFRVTPYLMDHSSIDAYGFLVEAEGKSIYYSGDFRTHGSRKNIYEWFEDDHPDNVDVLLMEGTMMGRTNKSYSSEKDVQKGMIKVLEETNGPCFLVSSGQHIDRLCRAYAACVQAKPKRKLVTDLYTGFVLYLVSKSFPSVPSIITKPEVRVLKSGRTYNAHKRVFDMCPDYFGDFLGELNRVGKQIDFKDVIINGQDYFLKVSNFTDLLEVAKREKVEVSVVYSQWSGYRLKRYDEGQAKKFKKVEDLVGAENFHEVHTSGHAVREDLERFSKLLSPKTLIPIHTEKGDEYDKYFQPNPVKVVADGETFQV